MDRFCVAGWFGTHRPSREVYYTSLDATQCTLLTPPSGRNPRLRMIWFCRTK